MQKQLTSRELERYFRELLKLRAKVRKAEDASAKPARNPGKTLAKRGLKVPASGSPVSMTLH